MIIVYPLPGGMGCGVYEPGATDRERAAERALGAERGEPGAMDRRYGPSAAKAPMKAAWISGARAATVSVTIRSRLAC